MFLIFLIALTPFQADKVEIFMEDDQRIVHLIGNVVIEGEATRITCSEAKISEVNGWVKLFRDVRLEDHNGIVSAVSAIYYFNEDRGYLRDSVKIVTSDEEISAESLYYDGARDSVEMYGNVIINDMKNDMSVAGDRGWFNLAQDKGLLSGSPRLEIMRQDNILSGTHGQFRLINKEIEMMSVLNGQSVYYTKAGSKNVVEGDTISIMFQDGKATRIRVDGTPKGHLSLKENEQGAGD